MREPAARTASCQQHEVFEHTLFVCSNSSPPFSYINFEYCFSLRELTKMCPLRTQRTQTRANNKSFILQSSYQRVAVAVELKKLGWDTQWFKFLLCLGKYNTQLTLCAVWEEHITTGEASKFQLLSEHSPYLIAPGFTVTDNMQTWINEKQGGFDKEHACSTNVPSIKQR